MSRSTREPRPEVRGLAVPILVVITAAVAGAAQEVHSDNPWEREMSAGLVVDQEQLEEDLLSGGSICQVFTPTATPLLRLDLVTKNRTDRTPGRIALWEWQGSYEQALQGEPLWEDDLQFHGQDAPYLRHYFPGVDVEPGKQYMLECSRPSEFFYMAGAKHDAYAGGLAFTNGKSRPDWDLWFRTFGPAAGEPSGWTPRPLPEIPDKAPRPPREPAPVTRDIYLQMVEDYVARNWQGWAGQHGRRASDLLFYTGFLVRFADQGQWAEQASGWLREAMAYLAEHEDYGGNPWYVTQMGWGIKWFRGNGLWTAEDEATAREVMLTVTRRLWQTPERGAMNRAMWDVSNTRLAAELYPDAPEAQEWREFSDATWHDWADYDDINEDSSHYNAVFLRFLLGYLRLTNMQDIFKRPGMRQFMDRYRDVITPNGMMVGWGDSVGCGADWGAWIAAFETAASATGDDNLPQLRREQGLPSYSLEDREVPWKMVMRDSPGEDAYYALFGLLPLGGHGHEDAPALLALFANGTMLMHDTAYFHKRWQDHNLLYAVRVSGGTLGEVPSETEVVTFRETDTICYADIAWRDYAGWGLDLRREILFVKGLGWWVRDRTDARQEFEWFLGPQWHVDRILARGESWFDVDYPEPMSFAWPVANGTDHLLIYFTPKPDASVDYADMTHRVDETKPWYSSVPWAVYQCEGPVSLRPDRQAHYNSLLVPLRRDEQADEFAQQIEVLLDEPGVTVMQLRRGDTVWTVALNNEGREITVGPVVTDARATVVEMAPGRTPVITQIEP